MDLTQKLTKQKLSFKNLKHKKMLVKKVRMAVAVVAIMSTPHLQWEAAVMLHGQVLKEATISRTRWKTQTTKDH
jgi:hypothetical protein